MRRKRLTRFRNLKKLLAKQRYVFLEINTGTRFSFFLFFNSNFLLVGSSLGIWNLELDSVMQGGFRTSLIGEGSSCQFSGVGILAF